MKKIAAYFFAVLVSTGIGTAQEESVEDKGFLTELLEDSLSGAGRTVLIDGFEGALSSRATFDEMTIADNDGVWLVIQDAAIQWTRSALFDGRIEVGELSAGSIEILRLPQAESSGLPTPEAKAFRLPDLSVDVAIDTIRADSVTLGAPILGQEIGLSLNGNLSLEGGEGAAKLLVTRTDGFEGKLDFEGRFANETQFLRLNLQLREGEEGIAARLLELPGLPSVNLILEGEGPLSDFQANVDLATDGAERLSGTLTLAEDRPENAPFVQTFTLDVGGDVSPLFLPEYQDFFGPDIQLNASGRFVEGEGAQITTFKIAAQSVALDGTARLAPDGLPEEFRITGQIAAPDSQPVRLPFGELPVHIIKAQLDFTFDAAKGQTWSGLAEVEELHIGANQIGQATFNAEGEIFRGGDGKSVSADMGFAAQNIALGDPALAKAIGTELDARLTLDWQEGAPVRLSNLTVQTSTARATLTATIGALKDALPLTAQGSTSIPDIAVLSDLVGQELAGRVVLGFNGTTNLLDSRFDFRASGVGNRLSIGVPTLDRAITGNSKVNLDARRDETGLLLRDLRIETDAALVEASGTLRQGDTNLRASATLEDAGQVFPGLQGPALIEAKLLGQEVGHFTASITGRGPGGASLSFDGTLTETDGQDITADGAAIFTVADLTAYRQVSGRRLSGAVEAKIEGAAAFAEDRFDLALGVKASNAQIGIATVDQLLGSSTTLNATATRNGEQTEITRFQLQSDELQADITGTLGKRDGQIEGRATLKNLALFAPDFPGELSVSGTLSRRNDRGWGLNILANGPGGMTATISGGASEMVDQLNLKLQGDAPLGLLNTSIAPRAVEGRASFDLSLNGPPEVSSLSGVVRTSGARVVAPIYGVSVEGISGDVALSGQTARVNLSGNVLGGGRAAVSGTVALDAASNAALSVTLRDAYFTDRSSFETTVTGDLTVTGPLGGAALLAGVLSLGETNVRIAESGLGTGGDIPGLIHLNEPYAVRLTRERAGLLSTPSGGGSGRGNQPYRLDILINAPDRIFVRGRGLDAELGGSVRLRGTLSDIIPQGEFSLIRGRLDLLGRRLALDEGFARMEGSGDAYVRLVATTETDEILARVVIEGLASEPEIRFESSPELPQDEILARLFFGKSLAELSAFQALRLASAVATLTGRGGVGFVDRLRDKFGLDDFDITSDSDGELAVRAGKYVSENVYTEVTLGVEGKSNITINLDVSPSVTVRGRIDSEGESGVGIFYERDY